MTNEYHYNVGIFNTHNEEEIHYAIRSKWVEDFISQLNEFIDKNKNKLSELPSLESGISNLDTNQNDEFILAPSSFNSLEKEIDTFIAYIQKSLSKDKLENRNYQDFFEASDLIDEYYTIVGVDLEDILTTDNDSSVQVLFVAYALKRNIQYFNENMSENEYTNIRITTKIYGK